MIRAALFARYSSKMQDETSLEAQVTEMERYCQERGWEIAVRYLLSETKSSDVEKSAEFQQMLDDARHKRFNVLLVHKLDRFGRDRETAVIYKAHLRRAGIKVVSVVENLGDSKMDRAMEGMLEVFNDMYRQNLAEETRKGHRQRTRNGYWTGGKVPWGLQAIDVNDTGRQFKRLVADPARGPVMAEVFAKVAGGDKTADVLAYVERETGERWNVASLYTRIRNAVYKGLLEYGKTSLPMGRQRQKNEAEEVVQGSWEGLVSEELWERANATLKERGRGRGKTVPTNRFYVLSDGIVTCANCGRPVIGSASDGVRRYACSNRRNGCTHRSIRADELEAMMGRRLSDYLAHLDIDKAIGEYERSLSPERDAAKKREAALRKRLDELKRKSANLVEAIADGLDDPGVRQKLRQLREEESELAQEISTCQLDREQAVKLNVGLVREHVESVRDLIKHAEPEELKVLLQDFFRLTLDLEKKEGQLFFRLTPLAPPEAVSWSKSGRSARI